MSGKNKQTVRMTLTALVILIQVLLTGLVLYLQKLSTSSAGVNHSLRFRRTYLLYHYFKPPYLMILSVLLVILIVFLCWQWKNKPTKRKNNSARLLSLFWSFLLLALIYIPYFHQILTYPFLIILGLVNAALSLILLAFHSR